MRIVDQLTQCALRIALVVEDLDQERAILRTLIAEARRQGMTYADIGLAIGVTKQRAQQLDPTNA